MLLAERKISLDSYRQLMETSAYADKLVELIDGELVDKEVGSFIPSKLAIEVAFLLKTYLVSNPIGDLTGADGTYEMNENNAFIPDVAYISKVRLPKDSERAAPIPPDLAVEVKSPSDSKRAMYRKAERYLEYGTQIVWLVFPEEKTVMVYKATQDDFQVVGVDGILDGGELLPGLAISVADIFKGLGE